MIDQWSPLNIFWLSCLSAGLASVGALYKPGCSLSASQITFTFILNAMIGGGVSLVIYESLGKSKAVGLAALTGAGIVKAAKLTKVADTLLGVPDE